MCSSWSLIPFPFHTYALCVCVCVCLPLIHSQIVKKKRTHVSSRRILRTKWSEYWIERNSTMFVQYSTWWKRYKGNRLLLHQEFGTAFRSWRMVESDWKSRTHSRSSSHLDDESWLILVSSKKDAESRANSSLSSTEFTFTTADTFSCRYDSASIEENSSVRTMQRYLEIIKQEEEKMKRNQKTNLKKNITILRREKHMETSTNPSHTQHDQHTTWLKKKKKKIRNKLQ